MWIVNAKKDEAVSLGKAEEIMIVPKVQKAPKVSDIYDVCVILSKDLCFNAGIDSDYQTVQTIFLWLVEKQSSNKTVVIDDDFVLERLSEQEDDEEWDED